MLTGEPALNPIGYYRTQIEKSASFGRKTHGPRQCRLAHGGGNAVLGTREQLGHIERITAGLRMELHCRAAGTACEKPYGAFAQRLEDNPPDGIGG